MTRLPPNPVSRYPSASQLLRGIGLFIVGILLASSGFQTWFSRQDLATSFVSPRTYLAMTGQGKEFAYSSVASLVLVVAVVTLLTGACWIAKATRKPFVEAMARLGLYGGIWWCLVDLWEWLWVASGILGMSNLSVFLRATPQFWLAFCTSGWITTLVCLARGPQTSDSSAISLTLPKQKASSWLWIACGCYIVTFTTMNWRLYFNLLIPHGDSAMYEEHLWNLLHGKGFRSYLDQGLFFGEHIQFVHLFLMPLYIFWPSHLLLELCESSALALGAFPVYWMTQRHTRSAATALAAAVAYLLYAPMQFLDIEIDLKTFRPEAFGIPLLLLTLDQLERRNLIGFLIGVTMTLTVKEDYAIIFGPLGLWIAVFGEWALLPVRVSSIGEKTENKTEDSNGQKSPFSILVGVSLSLFSVAYLWLATRVVMPWFRSGVEIHYVGYFAKLGKSAEEIVWNIFTKPEVWIGEIVSLPTALYAIALLGPVAFLPLFSPGRMAVGLPLLGILCLSDITRDHRHHFHAPLVAIIFWAIAGGLPHASRVLNTVVKLFRPKGLWYETAIPVVLRTYLWSTALTTGVFFTLSPLGIPFWDSGERWHWKTLYAPSRRAEQFVSVPPLIPQTSRVASTDFVHPRFTHHERSYDYSGYARKVSGYELRVPDDTDFIVIDTQHPYSEIKRPEQIREYRDHPDQWELLPDTTEGYFIILKRQR